MSPVVKRHNLAEVTPLVFDSPICYFAAFAYSAPFVVRYFTQPDPRSFVHRDEADRLTIVDGQTYT